MSDEALTQDIQTSLNESDEAYQDQILQYVSRTFALTIPQLPTELRRVVSNAYLLCRIADTVEDDNAVDSEQTRHLANMFVQVVAGNVPAKQFSDALYPLLSEHTIEEEHDLIKNTESVIRITHSFNDNQRRALERCVRIMAKGMADYQDAETLDGLENLAAMDDYCYYVAGVVGEMLTELFCDYSEEINANKDELMKLAVSFGQGLQMTNILKDIWDDRARGACWLPRDIFEKEGFDLSELNENNRNEKFQRGLEQLIGIARDHLNDALTYTLILPAEEKGIRKFCLWALGMAVLSLDKLNKNLDFSQGADVKITRRSVKATVASTSLLVSNDWALKKLFNYSSRNLPTTDIREKLGQVK
ncbi:MAG: phytoene/squalene synthase family protein [Gammaproteobacteria bacterium]|nr:phytoene/squalene synthase family protein [Gammaproteobacteria bacterium]